ncbi:MAG: thiamine-phosphate kinase [Candidatus Omnitrophota bacterium]
MNVGKLDEFGLIDLISRMAGSPPGVIKGIGDDCAVLPFDRENYLLLTCDMLVEGVDFTRRDRADLVGRKSLGVCLSDIAACGGVPRYAQVSLGLSPDTPVSRVKDLYRGIIFQARKFKAAVVGGDISRSDKLIIDVSLAGLVKKRNLALRSGAKKGDIIFVSGELGGSIYGRHLVFSPRIKEADYLVNNYKVSSMIDISDGLLQDLGHILKQSSQGAVIFEDLIPVSPDARKPEEALYMGEDFELLFTLPLSEARRLQKKSMRNLAKFSAVGEIVGGPCGLVLFNRQGERVKVKAGGFRHF